METHEILLRPVMTERATVLQERFNQVAFQVALKANKDQIRSAVEGLYDVTVTKITTMIVHGKTKRRGTKIGKRSNWKKALITLKQGDVIDFFAVE